MVDGAAQGKAWAITPGDRFWFSRLIGGHITLVRWYIRGRGSIECWQILDRGGQRRWQRVGEWRRAGINIRRVGVFLACGPQFDLVETELSSGVGLVGAPSGVLHMTMRSNKVDQRQAARTGCLSDSGSLEARKPRYGSNASALLIY